MVSIFGTNDTGITQAVLEGITSNVTGNTFLTLMVLFVILLVLALAMRLTFEVAALLIFPIILVAAAFTGDVMGAVGLMGIVLGIILAKNWIIR